MEIMVAMVAVTMLMKATLINQSAFCCTRYKNRRHQGILTCNRHPVHMVHRPRESPKEANHQTHHGKDNRACGVECDGIHQHRKGEQMAGHQEDQE